MSGKSAVSIAAMVILASISCAQPEPEPEPQTEPMAEPVATGADPTVVDSTHYTTELENDAVRILRIAYGPGEESVMHYHPDSVAVFLTNQLVEMSMPDGSAVEMPGTAGDAIFIPGGEHLPRNIAEEPLELILIELRSSEAASAEDGGPDATVVDADHYTTQFENERVRIVRVAYGPGEESAMHFHPANVAVFLTDLESEMTLPDGSIQTLSADAGDVAFGPAEQHQPKNASDMPLEVVLVELK